MLYSDYPSSDVDDVVVEKIGVELLEEVPKETIVRVQ